MTCVVLGGSRRILTLAQDVHQRLDRIVQQHFRVVLGDANGTDKAFQQYLVQRGYKNVELFCSGSSPRNNLGSWPCRKVVTNARPGTFEFYAAKDQAMAEVATVGFMLWDGKSVGTALNVWRLTRQRKSCLVYVQREKRFLQIRGGKDWRALMELAAAEVRKTIEQLIKNETGAGPEPALPLFGPDLHSVDLT